MNLAGRPDPEERCPCQKKQGGGELGFSEIAVKAHRGKVMQKMKAKSLADLVKMTVRLRLASDPKA